MSEVFAAIEFTPAKNMGLSAGGIMFGHQSERRVQQKIEERDQDIDLFGSYDVVFLGAVRSVMKAMRTFKRSRLLLNSGFEEIELSWHMPVEYRQGKGEIVPEDFAEEMLRGDMDEVTKYFGTGTKLSRDKKKILAPLPPHQQYSGDYYIGAYIPTPADAAVMKTAMLSIFGFGHAAMLAAAPIGGLGSTAGGLVKTGLEGAASMQPDSTSDPDLLFRISTKYFSRGVRITHDSQADGPATICSALEAYETRLRTHSVPKASPDDQAPRPRTEVHAPRNRAVATNQDATRRRNQANRNRMHPRRNLISNLLSKI